MKNIVVNSKFYFEPSPLLAVDGYKDPYGANKRSSDISTI